MKTKASRILAVIGMNGNEKKTKNLPPNCPTSAAPVGLLWKKRNRTSLDSQGLARIFWWKAIIQIRTEIIRNIREHDGLCAVLVVEGHYNAVIVEIDGIDEAVNQPLAVL